MFKTKCLVGENETNLSQECKTYFFVNLAVLGLEWETIHIKRARPRNIQVYRSVHNALGVPPPIFLKESVRCRCTWSPVEKQLIINAIKLKVGNIAVNFQYCSNRKQTKRCGIFIHFKLNNMINAVTYRYVNKMRGTKSTILTNIART